VKWFEAEVEIPNGSNGLVFLYGVGPAAMKYGNQMTGIAVD